MTQFSSRLGAVALALLMVIAAFAIAPPAAAQASDATEIDSCTVIDEAGTYVLTRDITDSDEGVCIRVVGGIDGVTIDGDGHTIDGIDDTDFDTVRENSGVFVYGEDEDQEGSANPSNVAIRDLILTDWEKGISFRYASGSVTNVQATSNGYGLSLSHSFAEITDSDFSDNTKDGIVVDFSNAEVSDVTANDNGNAGIWIYDGLLNLRDSTLTGNRVGIEEAEVSSITVTDSTIADNEVRNEYSTDGDGGNSDDGADGGDSDGAGDDAAMAEIDSCTVIDESGTYVLTQDIENSDAETCIRVVDGLDGVTIDGDGYTIDGIDDQATNGIYVGRESLDDGEVTRDVTVENVVLTDWHRGLVYENVENSTIRGNDVDSNDIGVLTFDASIGIEMADNVVTGNNEGIVTLGGSATIVDIVASNEVDYSSVASEDDGSPDNTVENLTLDTATISFEDDIDQVDFFGGGATLDLSAVESPPDDPDGLANVGGYVEAVADSNAGGTFALSVHYDDEALDGVDEDSLRLYQFADGEWTEVPGSAVDTDANTVSATFDDPAAFGDDTVLAPFGQADGDAGAVFPTLHRPTLSRVARTGLSDIGYDTDEIEEAIDEHDWLALYREYDLVPPALTTNDGRPCGASVKKPISTTITSLRTVVEEELAMSSTERTRFSLRLRYDIARSRRPKTATRTSKPVKTAGRAGYVFKADSDSE